MRDIIASNNFRYLAPFVVFMVLTSLQSYFTGTELFLLYGFKNLVAGLMLYFLFKTRPTEINGKFDLSSITFGSIAFIVWILLGENLGPLINNNREATFLPSEFNLFLGSSSLNFFSAVTIRTLGAVCIVPIMEELLWRSWLIRYIIKENFLEVSIGEYNLKSFWITVIAFASVHQFSDIPAALLVGIIYGYHLIKYKNLWALIGAHAVTNLLLAVYILYTGKYYYW